jgi:hypothetical protein
MSLIGENGMLGALIMSDDVQALKLKRSEPVYSFRAEASKLRSYKPAFLTRGGAEECRSYLFKLKLEFDALEDLV